MQTRSVWKATDERTSFPSLTQDITVDVAIIGGGITGITAASLLARSGMKVAVLEAHKVGQGSTGYSTGNLYATVGNKGLHRIRSKWNEAVMRETVASRAAAIDLIEQQVTEFGLDCHFRRVPWCLFSNLDGQESFIRDELEAVRAAGLQTADEIPFPLPWKHGFRIEGQAQLNPYEYVAALAKSIHSGHCSIYEHTKVVEVKEEEICLVHTAGGSVRASWVIMATHTPKGVYKVHASLGPYRESAIAVRLRGDYPPPGTFWYVLESEHYSMRTHDTPDGPVLMALGETYKVGQADSTEEKFNRLEAFLRAHFDVEEVAFRWAAQQYKPADGLPYIGPSSGHDKIYIATGFAADGLTWGTLAAMIISDGIQGIDNPWSDTFRAARTTPLASAGEFIKENINVLGQYLTDIPGSADAADVEEIPAGEGRIIESGGEKIAAYRDAEQQLHLCSAVCTHMDCIVAFNASEQSWDCPCHGSRFSIDGEVIEGPALRDLPKRQIKSD